METPRATNASIRLHSMKTRDMLWNLTAPDFCFQALPGKAQMWDQRRACSVNQGARARDVRHYNGTVVSKHSCEVGAPLMWSRWT
jgi:hypothetical protein